MESSKQPFWIIYCRFSFSTRFLSVAELGICFEAKKVFKHFTYSLSFKKQENLKFEILREFFGSEENWYSLNQEKNVAFHANNVFR